MPIFSISASGRVTVSAGSGVIAGQLEELRRGRVVDSDRRHDAELHDLPGRVGVGDGRSRSRRLAAAERLVRSDVPEHVVPDRDVA